MKIDLNKLLAFLGIAAEFAPDLAGASAWLASQGVGWLSYVARGLGVVALLLASLPRILPRARQALSSLGLATAPGALAPVPAAATQTAGGDVEGKVLPIVEADPQPPVAGKAPRGGAMYILPLVLGLSLGLMSCKTLSPAPDSFAGRVVACTEGNPADPAAASAVLTCLTGGTYAACLAGLPAAGGWGYDEIACIVRSYSTPAAHAMLAAGPVADPARANATAWLRAEGIAFRP